MSKLAAFRRGYVTWRQDVRGKGSSPGQFVDTTRKAIDCATTLLTLRGAKVPGSELARVLLADSLMGANWPGSEKAVNQLASCDELVM